MLEYVEFCEKHQNSYDQQVIKALSDLLSDEETRNFGPGTDLHEEEQFVIRL